MLRASAKISSAHALCARDGSTITWSYPIEGRRYLEPTGLPGESKQLDLRGNGAAPSFAERAFTVPP
jgi:hypothetical protein